MRKLPREPGWHLLGDVPLPLIAVLLSIATHKRRWLFSCAAVQEDDRTGKISYSHKSCRSKSKWIILFSEYFEDLLSVVGQTRGAEPYCRIQAFTPTVSCPSLSLPETPSPNIPDDRGADSTPDLLFRVARTTAA